MTPVVEGWTIVLAGFWNRAIFTPQWLQARNLFPADRNIGLELAVGTPRVSPRLVLDGINLRVEPSLLVVGTDAALDDRLTRMEELATRIAQELPHTPLMATGINFQWKEADPSDNLLRVFETTDRDRLADFGLQVTGATTIRRELEDNGQRINFSGVLDSEMQVAFDFNFHFETTSAEAARNAILNRTLQCRNRALDVLSTVYDMEPVAQ